MEFKELEKIYLKAEKIFKSSVFEDNESNWELRYYGIIKNPEIASSVFDFFSEVDRSKINYGTTEKETLNEFMDAFKKYYCEQKDIYDADRVKIYEIRYNANILFDEEQTMIISCKKLQINQKREIVIITADGVEMVLNAFEIHTKELGVI